MGSAAKASNARSATDGMPEERGHQVRSEVIKRNQRQSVPIRAHQTQSELIRRNQYRSSPPFGRRGRNQSSSDAIRAHQTQSVPVVSSIRPSRPRSLRSGLTTRSATCREPGRKRPGRRREARLPN